MRRKWVRIVAAVIAAAFLLTVFVAAGFNMVFAANEQSQIDASQKKVDEQKNKLKDIKGKQTVNAQNMEKVKADTASLQSSIDAKNAEIASIEAKLAAAEKELAAAKEKSDKQYKAYSERFRVMCEEGSVSYLEVILSSESFMDFIDKIEIANEISAYDNKMYKEMKEAEDKIAQLKSEIESSKTSLVSEKNALDAQKNSLSSKLNELETMKKALDSDAAAAQKVIDEEIKKQNALKAQVAARLSSTSDGSVYSGGVFVWPAPSSRLITSAFSPQRVNPVTGKLRPHTGTDIGAGYGTAVVAAAAGTVKFSGWNGGYGNCVIIDHGGGRSTLYAHMSSIAVSNGQSVSAGQSVGRVGSTGNSTGAHLHFEVLINGKAVNPMQYF